MDSSVPDRLTPLQHDLLREFFAREQRLFLTGGAALAGYDFGHRATDDLDLFATPPVTLDEPERALGDVALALGATVTSLSHHADFRRVQVDRGEERCIVDLVVDRAPVIDVRKRQVGAVRLDTLREMTANKVAALVGRSEIRDLVDLKCLLDSGQALEQALADAARKDAGVDPATVAWALDQLYLGPEARLPGGVDALALDRFRAELVLRLRKVARAQASD
jgi:Nucleotidyl transferase AbiEii toxin, Type IV TA system